MVYYNKKNERKIICYTYGNYMEEKPILKITKTYWEESANQWFGTTCLPDYGVRCVTENELHLFGDLTRKKMLKSAA